MSTSTPHCYMQGSPHVAECRGPLMAMVEEVRFGRLAMEACREHIGSLLAHRLGYEIGGVVTVSLVPAADVPAQA